MSGAAAAAATSAVISSSAAYQAAVEHCKTVLLTFDSKSATVSTMQEYASCVNTLYPAELTASTVIALKALLIIALVGMISGTVWSRTTKQNYGWLTHLLVGGFWFLFAPVITVFALSICYGIGWLFTG